MKEQLFRRASFENPDIREPHSRAFYLRPENTPVRLHSLLSSYTFRRCSRKEIEASVSLTENAWPGLPETTILDLRARDMINAPVCGAFDQKGQLVGYTRLLWGFDNRGKSEIFSHMTAVHKSVRDHGLGEALKWLARQVALEFPQEPVTQLTVTFDNLQGRICNLNFNKLGMVCGNAGGSFMQNVYGNLTGVQHLGNPTDRYKARWYLDSPWTEAHLRNTVRRMSLEDIGFFPATISYDVEKILGMTEDIWLPVPRTVETSTFAEYVVMPTPLDWDALLHIDRIHGYKIANSWRLAARQVIGSCYQSGYTTIGQVTDKEGKINFLIMAKDFDPFQPPPELLR